ncbi:MAG: hypothetical protein ACKVOW_00295 [Chitinophagaceae bacterium]
MSDLFLPAILFQLSLTNEFAFLGIAISAWYNRQLIVNPILLWLFFDERVFISELTYFMQIVNKVVLLKLSMCYNNKRFPALFMEQSNNPYP